MVLRGSDFFIIQPKLREADQLGHKGKSSSDNFHFHYMAHKDT